MIRNGFGWSAQMLTALRSTGSDDMEMAVEGQPKSSKASYQHLVRKAAVELVKQ